MIYYSLDSEIRAYMNNLDRYISDNGTDDAESIRENIVYKALGYIKIVLTNWGRFEPLVKDCFNIEPKTCFKMIEIAKDKYIRGIGRILAKYRMKVINENVYLSPSLRWYDRIGVIFDDIDRKAFMFFEE